MKNTKFSLIVFLMLFSIGVSAQMRDRKVSKNAVKNKAQNCRVSLNGKLLNNPQPVYPNEAKIAGVAGKVQAIVEIDESGTVTAVENILGNELLRKSALEAAFQAKFSPTLCDGKASKTIGVITFNYSTIALTGEYFKPSKIEDLADVTAEQNFYEAVLFLTENYQIAFGYLDQKFHAEMPLTKGDFAHFLRQALELLDSRAEIAKKNPREFALYQPFNPNQAQEIEFNPTAPFAESVVTLSDKYGIVLAEKDGNFEGNAVLKKAEIIQIWRSIFGEEAIPINFLGEKDNDQEMSRGDFAVYLKESLEVLTYKVLP
jgi:hypothetical protein